MSDQSQNRSSFWSSPIHAFRRCTLHYVELKDFAASAQKELRVYASFDGMDGQKIFWQNQLLSVFMGFGLRKTQT